MIAVFGIVAGAVAANRVYARYLSGARTIDSIDCVKSGGIPTEILGRLGFDPKGAPQCRTPSDLLSDGAKALGTKAADLAANAGRKGGSALCNALGLGAVAGKCGDIGATLASGVVKSAKAIGKAVYGRTGEPLTPDEQLAWRDRLAKSKTYDPTLGLRPGTFMRIPLGSGPRSPRERFLDMINRKVRFPEYSTFK